MDALNKMPQGHVVHPNLLRQLRKREQMVRGETGVDWGCAEALAIGSLVLGEGRGMAFFAPDALPSNTVPELRTLIERFARSDRYREIIASM